MKLDPAPSGDAIVLYNVSRLDDTSNGGTGGGNSTSSNALLTLINIEEDRMGKDQENYIRRDNTIQYKSPEICLNLYILFSVNLSAYDEALKRLSFIIQYFQHQSFFDSTGYPTLDPGIRKLMVDLYTMNFEQLNHLWGILGGKYLPSVLYKVRSITIDEEAITSESSFIKQVRLNGKISKPLS